MHSHLELNALLVLLYTLHDTSTMYDVGCDTVTMYGSGLAGVTEIASGDEAVTMYVVGITYRQFWLRQKEPQSTP